MQNDVPIAYSIEPQHVLKPIYKENNYNIEKICDKCDVVRATKKDIYQHCDYDLGEPLYISKDVLDDFHDFNATYEYFCGGYLLREVVMSKRVCDFILSIYPRAEFRPVLIKEEPIETEEMIQRRLRQQKLAEWRERYRSKQMK